MIEVYALTSGKISHQSIHDTNLLRSITWIDATSPTPTELTEIKDKTGIPLQELRHALDSKERPRIKTTSDFTLIIFGTPQREPSIPSSPLGIFFTKRYVLTIHKEDIPALREIKTEGEIFKRVMERGTEYILYTTLFRVIKEYFTRIDTIEDSLNRIESEVARYTEEGTQRISILKTKLTYLHKSLLRNHEVLSTLTKAEPLVKEKRMFEDLNTEIMQLIDEIELFIERLNTTFYLHLTAISNKINDIMKIFTVLASLLLIPSIISGLYGMNVILPLQQHPLVFWMIVLITIIAMAIMLVVYKVKRWI